MSTGKVITVANRDVVRYANYGRNAEGYGNLSTRRIDARYFAMWTGVLPTALKNVFSKRVRERKIHQVIWSYSTPIAWAEACPVTGKIVWIVPSVSYSVTTSKHQGHLWQLEGERYSIPHDVSYDEYMRVLSGQMIFGRHPVTGNYQTLPGAHYTLSRNVSTTDPLVTLP